jgi:hypothetical protein
MSFICVSIQEQQRALKAAQQKAKVPQAKSTVTIAAVNSKEKQPQKNAGDDVSFHLCTLSLICGAFFVSYSKEVNLQLRCRARFVIQILCWTLSTS